MRCIEFVEIKLIEYGLANNNAVFPFNSEQNRSKV